jgi:flagellin
MKIQNQAMVSFSVTRYQKNNAKMDKTIEKLASGMEIKKASDNPTGLAISETMRAQIRGLSQAQRNMQDGLSVLQAENEGLNHVNSLLQRARELTVMASNDTLTFADREATQNEYNELLKGINDTAEKLEFNTKKILGDNAPLVLMVGSNPGQQIKVNLVNVRPSELGLDGTSMILRADAEKLIIKLDNAITKVTSHLTKVGSDYEVVEHHLRNASLFEANITTSFSRLKDANMASKMLDFVSINIQKSADQLLVSNVNQGTREALELLK